MKHNLYTLKKFYKENYLIYSNFFITGSCVFDFIKNNHDIDFSYKNKQGYIEFKQFLKEYKTLYNSNYKIDIFKLLTLDNLVCNILYFPVLDSRINKYSNVKYEFNKKDLVNYLLNFKLIKGQEKVFYRFEILLEFLENDLAFNPTEQQKELINNLHDCKINLNEYLKEVNIRLDKLKIFL